MFLTAFIHPIPNSLKNFDPLLKGSGFFIGYNPIMNPKYIVLEGLDGSGKTTHLANAASFLEKQGIPVVTTREPGSPHIALKVRDLVLSHQKLNPAALELLFEADRAEHTGWVKEQLEQGKWVLSDRSYISGLAYSNACGTPFEKVAPIMEYAIQVYPDFGILFDITVETMLERRSGDKKTREEAKSREFHEKVRENLLWLACHKYQPVKIPPFYIANSECPMELMKATVEQVLLDLIHPPVQKWV